jgi:uncharacterized protein YegJ (DUF2314 family)
MRIEENQRSERTIDVILWLGLCGLGAWSAGGLAPGPARVTVGIVALLCLVVAAGRWLGRRWARIVAMIVFGSCIALLVSVAVRSGWTLWRGLGIGCGLLGLWHEWRKFREQSQREAEEAAPRSMISLVLLQRELPYFEARTLAELLAETWGGTYEIREAGGDTEPGSDAKEGGEENPCFIGGDGPFIVSCATGLFVIHRHSGPYWDDIEAVLEEVREMRMRQAIAEHRGWVAVDLLQPYSDAARESFYPQIAKLLAELADENTLCVIQPEAAHFSPWTEQTREMLRGSNPLAIFESPTLDPVIAVPGDDPRMVAAVEEARRRWPEFVEAFARRQPQEPFLTKVRLEHEGAEEFIWIEITGIEPDFVHGTLANDPVNLGPLQRGDTVEVPRHEVTDWLFPKGGEAVGGFTQQAIAAIEAERRTQPRDQSRS